MLLSDEVNSDEKLHSSYWRPHQSPSNCNTSYTPNSKYTSWKQTSSAVHKSSLLELNLYTIYRKVIA